MILRPSAARSFFARLKKLFRAEELFAKRQKSRCRPTVENLENRLVPAGPPTTAAPVLAAHAEDGAAFPVNLSATDNNTPGSASITYRFSALPDWGTLYVGATPIYLSQEIVVPDAGTIANLNLTYVPGGNSTGNVPIGPDGFGYVVTDGTGQSTGPTAVTVPLTDFSGGLATVAKGVPDSNVLYVTGTNSDDRFTLSMIAPGGVSKIRVVRQTGNVVVTTDVVAAGITEVRLFGRLGNDSVDATALTVKITMVGGAGNERFLGSATAMNVMYGGADNDTMTGGGTGDLISAGNGNDAATGGAGADLLYGGNGNDALTGLGGADRIYGGDGADNIDAGEGDDIIYFQVHEADNDYNIIGGGGTDTFEIIKGTGAGFLKNFRGEFDLTGKVSALQIGKQIEIVKGNGQPIRGSDFTDFLDFHAVVFDGVPFVDTGAGMDILIGTIRADDLRGGAGIDVINGFGSNQAGTYGVGMFPYGYDVIDGGAGSDSLTGGGGANGGAVFVIDRNTDNIADDVITDYVNTGAHPDKLRLLNFGFTAAFTIMSAPPLRQVPFTGAPNTVFEVINGGDLVLWLPGAPVVGAKRIRFKNGLTFANITANDFDF